MALFQMMWRNMCAHLYRLHFTEGMKMEERDQAALAALPAILAYILNERTPPIDDHEDDRWLQAFLEARDMSYQVGNHWAFRK